MLSRQGARVLARAALRTCIPGDVRLPIISAIEKVAQLPNSPSKLIASRPIFSSIFLQPHTAELKAPEPWFSTQRRSVTFLRATHANGERQGIYNDVEIKVTNFNNEDKGTTTLAGDVFDVPIRKDIVHRVVVWQLAKRRQGTHCTKTISEVSGTGKKPYKQKGTGNARHGTLRGPQFRHGATMHGPKPRDYSYNLPKKVRRLGLKIALSARVAEGKLIVMDDVTPASHKTRDMAKYIESLDQCKRILIVDDSDNVNTNLLRSTSNLYAADVIPAKGLNVYSILQHDALIMSVDAIRHIENRMHTPINR